MSDISARIEKIKAIEDGYGLLLFGMALSHLVDVGIRHFDEKNVADSIQKISADYEEMQAKGSTPFMSVEFQQKIVHCAAELSIFTPWELFTYIKKYVAIK